MAPPTRTQLVNGAQGIAYRCAQLAGQAVISGRHMRVEVRPPVGPGVEVLTKNALVESALVHARVLAAFLGTSAPGDVAARHYVHRGKGKPVDPALELLCRSQVLSPISTHLAHAAYPAATELDPKHPGAWPLVELAVVLVGGVASLVQSLDDRWRDAFGPISPVGQAAALGRIVANQPHHRPRSEHPDVVRLTDALWAHLGWSPATTG